ncbi:MAG: hypothetical protein QM639_10090 [Rhodocyclaceae bacterium]
MPSDIPSRTAPAILDFEASGFGRGSYPIEVGFILPDGVSFCSLIQPAPEWAGWDSGAERIHGISRELLTQRGRPIDDIAILMNERLRGLTVYCDGWAHDYVWLNQLFDAAHRVPAFKLDHLASILPEAQANRWNTVRDEVERELGLARHRASNDARILQATWRRLHDTPLPQAA